MNELIAIAVAAAASIGATLVGYATWFTCICAGLVAIVSYRLLEGERFG